MAHRTFLDSRGTEWQAWDVQPQGVERRRTDRRIAQRRIAFGDRRAAQRRIAQGRWSLLGGGLRNGWLCFDGAAQRRRLVPIPPDWESCPEDRLADYCEAASPVRRSSGETRLG